MGLHPFFLFSILVPNTTSAATTTTTTPVAEMQEDEAKPVGLSYHLSFSGWIMMLCEGERVSECMRVCACICVLVMHVPA